MAWHAAVRFEPAPWAATFATRVGVIADGDTAEDRGG
jgi:hypothetical protein